MNLKYSITVSDEALRAMTLSTAEAYVHGDGQKRKKQKTPAVETLGFLWGHCTQTYDEMLNIHIDMMSLSLSAERDADSVGDVKNAVLLKNALLQRWAPHLMLVGDFHSHPYNTLSEVNENTGYEFSKADIDDFLENDIYWKDNENPIMVVMTICRLSKVHEAYNSETVRNNVVCFDVGEFRFWMNVAVGFLTEDGKRSPKRNWTGNTYSTVELRLDSKFYNYSGDRLLS